MLNETDLSRIDLNLLVLFETVLAERHVGRAAARLNLSPSAISHGLGRLRRLLNDPLFLRTPKGVSPSQRALALQAPVAEILARIRQVVATAAPFNPAHSRRRFTLGAPDGVSAFLLPALLGMLKRTAPQVDISIRPLLPAQGGRTPQRAWLPWLDRLETGALDIAILPIEEVPARFARQALYDEDFVIAMRKGHAFAARPTLDRYCQMQHLVVSQSGDPEGFMDEALAKLQRQRRVMLTVPSFSQALAILAESDLIAALPRRLAMGQAERFGLVTTKAPLTLQHDPICAVATRAALMDAGIAWLFGLLQQAVRPPGRSRTARHI